MGILLTLALLVISFVLSALLRPKPQQQDAKAAAEGDFTFPTATEGRVVPLIWGTVQIKAPNVIWYGDYKPISYSHRGVIHTWTYYFGLQFALCRGPVDRIQNIWVGEYLAWGVDAPASVGGPHTAKTHGQTIYINAPKLFGADRLGGATGVGGFLWFYEGNDTQTVSSYLQAQQGGATGTPAYRGICYLTTDINRFYFGTSTQIHPWWFEVEREIPASPTANTVHRLVNTHDANPAFVAYEIMTNKEWGLGYAATDIDEASFKDAAEVCYTEGNGFSFILDNPREATELLDILQEQMDGIIYQSQITGKYKIAMIRPDADLPTAPAAPLTIDETNLIELTNFARGAWDNTPNEVFIEFLDRADEYKQTFAAAQDLSNFEIQGGVAVRSTIKYPGVRTAALANQIAWRELATLSYPLSKATVVVNRDFWDQEVGRRVQLTHAPLGLNLFGMRILSVNLGNLAEGKITLELVEDIFRAENGVYTPPPNTGWGHPGGSFSDVASGEYVIMEAPRAFTKLRQEQDGSRPSDARLFVAARAQSGAAVMDVRTRHGATDPSSGDYELDDSVVTFMKVGDLWSALRRSWKAPRSPGTPAHRVRATPASASSTSS
jgi:hypothetical protein